MAQGHKTLAHLRMESIRVKGGKNTSATMELLVATETQSKECHLWCKLSCAGVSDGALLSVLWRRSMLFMEGSPYKTWHIQYGLLHMVQSAGFGTGCHVHIWLLLHSFPSLTSDSRTLILKFVNQDHPTFQKNLKIVTDYTLCKM